MNYALVNIENNIVENIIVLEDGAVWTLPDGFITVPLVYPFTIGDTWDGDKFIAKSISIAPIISTEV